MIVLRRWALGLLIGLSVLGCKGARTAPTTNLSAEVEKRPVLIANPPIAYSAKAYEGKEVSDIEFYRNAITKIENDDSGALEENYTNAVLEDYIKLLDLYGKPGSSKKRPTFTKLSGMFSVDGYIEEALEQRKLTGEEKAEFLVEKLESASSELEEFMFELSWKNLVKLFEQTRIAMQVTQTDGNDVERTYDMGVGNSFAVDELNLDMYLEELNFNVLAEIQKIDYVATRVSKNEFAYQAYSRMAQVKGGIHREAAQSKEDQEVFQGAQYQVSKNPETSFLVNGPRSSFVFQGLGQLSNNASNKSLLMSYFKLHQPGENDDKIKQFAGRALQLWNKTIVPYHVYRTFYIRAVAKLVSHYIQA